MHACAIDPADTSSAFPTISLCDIRTVDTIGAIGNWSIWGCFGDVLHGGDDQGRAGGQGVLPDPAGRGPRARTTTYGALVDEAKARNPDDDVIAALIPRAVGRRLLVLRGFTDESAIPIFPAWFSTPVRARSGTPIPPNSTRARSGPR